MIPYTAGRSLMDNPPAKEIGKLDTGIDRSIAEFDKSDDLLTNTALDGMSSREE